MLTTANKAIKLPTAFFIPNIASPFGINPAALCQSGLQNYHACFAARRERATTRHACRPCPIQIKFYSQQTRAEQIARQRSRPAFCAARGQAARRVVEKPSTLSSFHPCQGIIDRMDTPNVTSLDELKQRVRIFAEARDWQAYHTPKNLTMALIVEAAELVEPFQWLTPEQSLNLPANTKEAVRQEMADVLIYLTRLADVLDIDLLDAASAKLAINAAKYPVERARGNADKYSKPAQ
jgi:Predicted pyrophosphatase